MFTAAMGLGDLYIDRMKVRLRVRGFPCTSVLLITSGGLGQWSHLDGGKSTLSLSQECY
jgi:hypothetical protein